MSLMYCTECDALLDTDEDNCHCTDVEVTPGVFQSKEDYEANMAYDEMIDNQLQDELSHN